MPDKIQNFDPRDLRNAEHVRFGEEVETICQNHFPPGTPIGDELRANHTQGYKDVSDYFSPQRKNPLTRQLILADRNRDRMFSGLLYATMSASFHPDPARKQAAETLLNTYSKYGKNINQLNYGAQTAVVDNLLEDFVKDTEVNASLTQLNLTEWVTLLTNANQQFKTLYDQRADGKAGPDVKATELRATLRLAYLELADYINGQISVTRGSDPWQKMAYLINERIRTWKQVIARRGEADEQDGDEDNLEENNNPENPGEQPTT